MSDRRLWLEEACPECHAVPGLRCAERWNRARPVRRLHFARGWRQRPCPTCKAQPGETCWTPGGRTARSPHTARLRIGRREMSATGVWEELERHGAAVALVVFHGGAKLVPGIERVILQDPAGAEITRWSDPDGPFLEELAAPVWERYALFRGQPRILATVAWDARSREVIVTGRRGQDSFSELLHPAPRDWSPPPATSDTSRDTSVSAPPDHEADASPAVPIQPTPMRRCSVCAAEISPDARAEARYCSKRCRQAASRARIREERGRAGLTAPERCAQCDGPIPAGVRPEARYCSKRCRQAASRARLRTARTP